MFLAVVVLCVSLVRSLLLQLGVGALKGGAHSSPPLPFLCLLRRRISACGF